MMKKVLSWGLLTIIYLLVLGQGCSALKEQSNSITLKIPQIEGFGSKALPRLKLKKAPESKSLLEKQEEKETLATVLKRASKKKLELKPKVEKQVFVQEKKKTVAYEVPVKKSYEVQVENPKKIEEVKLTKPSRLIEKDPKEQAPKYEINNNFPIEHYGFKSESKVKLVTWQDQLPSNLEERLLALNEQELLPEKTTSPIKDEVIVSQASSEKKAYNPTDPEMLAMFQPEEITIDPVKPLPKGKASSANDELVMIDYKEENENIHDVAKVSLSSEVRKVIEREMGGSLNQKRIVPQVKPQESLADLLGDKLTETRDDNNPSENQGKNRISLFAINANLGVSLDGLVNNFNFIPTYDDSKVYEDFNEGRINFDYSLVGNAGVLRGSIAKNYYMRTTFEIPLGSEYSKFEIPMITQESMFKYLEDHNLDGYGGYYLVDLGDFIEDVEIEKSGVKGQIYQHRLLLNESFSRAKENETVQYILFFGVEPGNINTRYLGINGQETSKITFVAPDEITYDFSKMVAPAEFKMETFIRHTLGRESKPLPMSQDKIIDFLTGNHPELIVPGEFKVSTPWMIKGSRTYLEFNHLSDSIFVGIDGDRKVTVPSREFIGEILSAFQIEGLNQECLVQINLRKPVRDIRVFGESDRGPSVYDTAYLDSEGVFSSEISQMSEKLFLLGNEEGIFNLRVDYKDGTQDFLRTYCSPSSYLLEQL